jgi:hypothetical protein
MRHDYSIYERHELDGTNAWTGMPEWDYFLSGFNLADRIKITHERVRARHKVWLIHEEYGLSDAEMPPGSKFGLSNVDESTYCKALLTFLTDNQGFKPGVHTLCIDITGVLRPHLMFLVRLLKARNVLDFTALYAEPLRYQSRERTTFSSGNITAVRPVHGFEGSPTRGGAPHFLIIGVGYDDKLLAAVAEHRAKAEKHQLFGLPSLRADMFQESVLRSRRASEEIGDPNFSPHNRSFAPANDPFGTASVLSEIVDRQVKQRPDSDIILAPLGTKAQVLGFALYYMLEAHNLHYSIIFPFSTGYAAETSTGLARIWAYRIEL